MQPRWATVGDIRQKGKPFTLLIDTMIKKTGWIKLNLGKVTSNGLNITVGEGKVCIRGYWKAKIAGNIVLNG
jgi:hypothetical protein